MLDRIAIDFPVFTGFSLFSAPSCRSVSRVSQAALKQDVDAASKVVHRRDEQSETKLEDLMSMQNLDRIERLQKLERQVLVQIVSDAEENL